MLELILKIGLAGAKPAPTPLESNIKLTSVKVDESARITNDMVLRDASLS